MVKYLVLGSTGSFIMSLASLLVVARLFSFEFVSDLKAFVLYSGLFSTIGTLQIHSGVLYFSSNRSRSGEVVLCQGVLSLLLSAMVTALVFHRFFPILYPMDEKVLVYLSATVPFNVLFISSPAIYSSFGVTRVLPAFSVACASSQLLSLILTFHFEGGIYLFSKLYFLSLVVVFLFSSWRVFIGKAIAFLIREARFIKGMYSYSIKMALANSLEALGDKIDKIFVSSHFDKLVFAKYSIVAFESPLTNILLNSFGIELVKLFAERIDEKKNEFLDYWRSVNRITTLFTFPISAVMVLFSSEVVTIVFGERFSDASIVFILYGIVSVFRPAPYQALLRVAGLAGYNAILAFGFCFSSSVLCFLIIGFELDYFYLCLGYLGGWVTFNALAIMIFCRKSNFRVLDVICLDIVLKRLLQSYGIGAVTLLFFDDILPSLAMYCFFYILLIVLLDEDAKKDLFSLLSKKWRKA